MKRRLTLARALVNRPELLILDEPTTGLDPQARHLIWERLRRLTAEGTTILLTTHFMDEAERLANRLAIMDAGRILAQGSPREVIAAHIEPQVVEIFGEWQGEGAAAWAAAHAHALCQRCEVSGETAFCYTDDAAPLLAHLAHQPGLRSLHRPANLEDVFLNSPGATCATDDASPLAPPRLSLRLAGRVAAQLPGVAQARPALHRRQPGRPGDLHARPGYGLGMLVPEVEGVSYIAFLAGGTLAYSTMNAATFEALYSGFSRMHTQKTWEAIMNAPVASTTSSPPSCCGRPASLPGRRGHPRGDRRLRLRRLAAGPGGDPGDLPHRPVLRRPRPDHDRAGAELRLLHVLLHPRHHPDDPALRRVLSPGPAARRGARGGPVAAPVHAVALVRPLLLGQMPGRSACTSPCWPASPWQPSGWRWG
jgi:hypothetical protein